MLVAQHDVREIPAPGWFRIPRGLVRSTTLTATDKLLLIALLDVWNSKAQTHEWFYASNRLLVSFSGLTEKSVLAARQRLVAYGLIAHEPGHRCAKVVGRIASRYKLSDSLKQSLTNTPLPLNTSTLVVP